jgi:hypothetical protein
MLSNSILRMETKSLRAYARKCAVALLLVVGGAMAIVYVRSFLVYDRIGRLILTADESETTLLTIAIGNGRCGFVSTHDYLVGNSTGATRRRFWHWSRTTEPPSKIVAARVLPRVVLVTSIEHAGLLYFRERSSFPPSNGSGWRVGVQDRVGLLLPPWIVPAILILALLPILIRSAKRHSRIKQGRCAGCGYDLRSSPERCPECGQPVPRQINPRAQRSSA